MVIKCLAGLFLSVAGIHAARVFYKLIPYFQSISSANKKLLHICPLQCPVLITGATDGIGREVAQHFHKLGYNLLVHGRNSNKLSQLERQMPGIVTLQSDLRQSNNIIIQAISQHGVNMIINCAGVTRLDLFEKHSHQDIQTLVAINVNNPTTLLHALIRNQTQSNNQKIFVNISSMTALTSFPYLGLYAATKTFQKKLFEIVEKENPNLLILNIFPWYVSTKMTAYRRTWDTQPTHRLVQGLIKLLAYGRSEGLGSIKHELISLHLPLFSSHFLSRLKSDYSKLMEIRKRRRK